jgi:predicted ribonuclease YlaK
MDPEIPIVALTGPAGTGKTILALGSALEQVVEVTSEHHHYDRIMILRPIYAVERQEIGFLPGPVEEKMGPWSSLKTILTRIGDGSKVPGRPDPDGQPLRVEPIQRAVSPGGPLQR